MNSFKAIPAPARVFGFAGLIPFFVGAALCWATDATVTNTSLPLGSFVLTTYSAVILSFLGGIRWGVAMQHPSLINDWQVVAFAMVPSLVAWAALLTHAKVGLPMLLVGFSLQYVIDYRSTKNNITPPWFLTLRSLLTLGAILSVLVGWLGISGMFSASNP